VSPGAMPGGLPPGGLGDVDLGALLKPGAFNQPGRRGR
jgi:signal recognition particle subunit SRP54